MNYLGKYLRKRLREMKMSEREISAKCGISHSYLNQLIKGVNPSTNKSISPTLATFEKLSVGFNVSVEFLQKIARGIIEDKTDYSEKYNSSASANLDKKSYSPEMLNQIKEFQDFMTEIGYSRNTASSDDWRTLIAELKETVKKHVNDKHKNIS